MDDDAPTYNVYALIDGALDSELSSDDYQSAYAMFKALYEAYSADDVQVEVTIHLYDAWENRLMHEVTISRKG